MIPSVLNRLKLPPTKVSFFRMLDLSDTSMGKAEVDIMLLFFGESYNSMSDTYVKTTQSKKIGKAFAELLAWSRFRFRFRFIVSFS